MSELITGYLFSALSAFVGTVAFSLLFHVASKHFFLCGIIGASGWLAYIACQPWLSVVESCFVATVVIVLLSRFFANHNRCPVTCYLIPGIFPLVPGAGVYWTAYYSLTHQAPLALSKGLETLQIAVAIVLGIVLIGELPQKFFVKKKKS